MSKKQKPKLTDGLKPLKKVEGILPHFFDLMWDVKDASDLRGYEENIDVQRALAEHGYDVKGWLQVWLKNGSN